MIRQTTTLPVVEPPDLEADVRSGVGRWLFIALEVVLLGSIPVLGVLGFQSLLGTRSGEFAVEPGEGDAGWVAAVEPSPLSILVDVDDGRVGGAVLLVPNGDGVDGGTIILISGATQIEGSPLSERTPSGVVEALEGVLRLELGVPGIADSDGWDLLLGGASIELANPDPVVGDETAGGVSVGGASSILIPAGRVKVPSSDLAALSTRAPIASSDPEALEFRREVLWRTLLDDATFDVVGLAGDETLTTAVQYLGRIANGVHRIETLPLDGAAADMAATEELIRSVVSLPRGHEVGARLQVRIIDRSGDNDLEAAARNLGRAGFEVVQVSNAFSFDDGPTQVLATPTGAKDEIARLADLADAATVPPSFDAEATSVVTLLLGADVEIAQSTE